MNIYIPHKLILITSYIYTHRNKWEVKSLSFFCTEVNIAGVSAVCKTTKAAEEFSTLANSLHSCIDDENFTHMAPQVMRLH